MAFRVLHHNQCFDGACSAAVFTKFHRECIGGANGYEYRGLEHGAGGQLSETIFGPEENAIVDFKYSSSPKLTWWFDHHQSAFPTPNDFAHFEEGQRGALARRQFFNAEAISCTGLIASIATSKFSFDATGLEDLLYWADIIDGAKYESAAAAVEMKQPAMKLTLVIENAADGEFIPRIIPLLTAMPLAEVLAQPFVEERVAPLWATHVDAMELIRTRAKLADGVIEVDLGDRVTDAVSKFIPYYYSPEATYAVVLTRSRTKTKISVGTNPWFGVPASTLVNLADICGRYGGGGHARVGAISFGVDDVEKARTAMQEILVELRTGG